jgi:hypothetical protein
MLKRRAVTSVLVTSFNESRVPVPNPFRAVRVESEGNKALLPYT